ncbi:MAG TPA: SagB/ThcOx family dehydrogenase [Anaerolineales bacterium]|nr:SagB/ThcOx family dehydrogenase [Anaerolineales bacterium]
MQNRDTQAGWRYHDGTKHPYGPLMNPWHRFDPATQPLLFKKYLHLESVPLELEPEPSGVSALDAIAGPAAGASTGVVDGRALARLLYFSAGITKTIRYPWGEIPFRAAACTGALYHIELYAVCGDLPGLEAGVYHFDPETNSLDVLRKGDYRQVLVRACADEEAVAKAPAVIAYSDVFWRNSCKYQAREYRHAFWDSGTILSHTLALASALRLPARLVLGFVDREVDRLLALDGRNEASLALLAVGSGGGRAGEISPGVEELSPETLPISRYEIDLPAIREMHQASSLSDAEEVAGWRAGGFTAVPDAPPTDAAPLERLAEEERPSSPLEKVIQRRGSSRRFVREPISLAQLSTILTHSTGGFSADYSPGGDAWFNQPYLIIQAVDGIPNGAYAFHRDPPALELLKTGEFRAHAGQLGLGQALPADAAINIYFLADLTQVFGVFGNRGYRLAQLEASIAAGKIYLAAYALGLGATGLTFYDDEVVDFFSPHAKGKSVMFLIALGRSARRARTDSSTKF